MLNSIFRRASTWLLVCLAAITVAGAASAADPSTGSLQPIPALSAHVTDTTQTLNAGERQALEVKLADWETRTGNQLAVLLVPTTAPETIEEYSLRVAEAWKIGKKGQDNGALFLIAKNDKRMRIEVGYGLEGTLTDVASRRIIGDVVAPYFKQGQFAAGINAGVDRIIATASGDVREATSATPARRSPRSDFGGLESLFVILLVVVPVLGWILRSMFGTLGGSVIGGGIISAAAWFIAGSLLIAVIAGIVAFVIMMFSLIGGHGLPLGVPIGGGWGRRGGGLGGGGFGGSGGGWSGGGGSFGGGGASGSWN